MIKKAVKYNCIENLKKDGNPIIIVAAVKRLKRLNMLVMKKE